MSYILVIRADPISSAAARRVLEVGGGAPISIRRRRRQLLGGGKHLHYCEANVFRIIFANFCQNRLDFADNVIKTFWFDLFSFRSFN